MNHITKQYHKCDSGIIGIIFSFLFSAILRKGKERGEREKYQRYQKCEDKI